MKYITYFRLVVYGSKGYFRHLQYPYFYSKLAERAGELTVVPLAEAYSHLQIFQSYFSVVCGSEVNYHVQHVLNSFNISSSLSTLPTPISVVSLGGKNATLYSAVVASNPHHKEYRQRFQAVSLRSVSPRGQNMTGVSKEVPSSAFHELRSKRLFGINTRLRGHRAVKPPNVLVFLLLIVP